MLSQKESVYKTVTNVMGKQEGAYQPTPKEKLQIIEIISTGIMQGEIAFSEEAKLKYDTPDKVKSYTSGMVSNHLRKDTRLNGGTKYQIKNPGSRAGTSDPEIKAMRALIKSGTLNPAQLSIVQERLDAKLAEIKANKVEIDLSAIPADLLEKLGL